MEIECRFELNINNELYTCFVDSGSKKNIAPKDKIKSFEGTHAPEYSDNDVKMLIFRGSLEIEIIPKQLSMFFVRLESLKIDDCGLKRISRRDLIGFKNLKSLSLRNNPLKSLPNDLFLHMRDLHTISFDNCKLESLSSKLFSPLEIGKLKFVSFRGNVKIDVAFVPGVKIRPGKYETLEDLMKTIDANCDKPPESEGPKFSKEFGGLSQRSSNFLIKADAKEFPVHKRVLSDQSKVFAAMFENDMQENQQSQMTIEEFSASAVEDFLHYLYSEETPDETNAMELFALSAKYDVPSLKLLTEEMILYNVDHSNAYEVFSLGHLYSSDDMKILAYKEVKKMYPFRHIPQQLMERPEYFKRLVDTWRDHNAEVDSILRSCQSVD